MKRFLLLFAVVCFAGLGTANAQCTKAKKAACAKKSVQATSNDAETFAMKAALEDETVERKVCAKSGNVSYHKSSTCAKSGAVSVNQVQWCTKSSKFVNVSPSEGAAKPACTKGAKKCTKAEKAACAKSAKAGKACCAGAKEAGCCAKKGAAGAKAIKASNTSAKKACTKGAKKCSKPCGSKAKASSASIDEVKAVKVSNEG